MPSSVDFLGEVSVLIVIADPMLWAYPRELSM